MYNSWIYYKHVVRHIHNNMSLRARASIRYIPVSNPFALYLDRLPHRKTRQRWASDVYVYKRI